MLVALTVIKNFLVGALAAWSYIALVAVLFTMWNMWIENPRIREEARGGYVLEVSAVAAKAELDERMRQANAAILATNMLKATIDKQKAEDDATLDAKRKDLQDYAAKLKADKRSCPLTGADIDWLRKK
jgi:hypothetical protein